MIKYINNLRLVCLICFMGYQNAERNFTALSFKIRVNVKFVPEKLDSINGVCITEICNKTAKELLSYVDLRANPCEDFYDFVCGTFLRNQSIRPTFDDVHNFEIVEKILQHNIEFLFTATEVSLRFEKDIKMFYQTCMNIGRINVRGLDPLLGFIDQLGGWPLLEGENWNINVNLWKIMVQLHSQGLTGLFKISFQVDDETKLVKTTISAPEITFPLDYYGSDSLHPEYLEALKTYIVDVAGVMAEGSDKYVIDTEYIRVAAEEIINVESNISVCMLEQKTSDSVPIKRLTLQEFDKNYNHLKFSIMVVLKNMYKRFYQVNNHDKILIHDSTYLKCLNRKLTKFANRDIYNYIIWNFIKSFTYALPQYFRNIRSYFFDAVHGFQEYDTIKEACVDLLGKFLSEPLDAFYAKKFLSKATKKRATDIVIHVKRAYLNMIQKNRWMEYEIIDATVKKLKHMKHYIGYPTRFEIPRYFADMFSLGKMTKALFFENFILARKMSFYEEIKTLDQPVKYKVPRVTIINGYYNFNGNYLEITGGYLTPPIYNDHYPKYLNFGSLGYTIGHEVTHGLDDTGRLFNENGEYKDLWNERTLMAFQIKAICYTNQYSSFVVPEANKSMNGIKTINEDIADNVGVKVAYSAYINWLQINGEEPRLPGFDFNSRQMYFISYARYFCGKPTLAGALDKIEVGLHSPSRFRANVPLKNSVEFAEAFNCRAGSPMNPIKKCTFW